MEPGKTEKINGLAPLLVWCNDSPTIKPSSPGSENYKTASSVTPCDDKGSNASSGIGKDSPESTSESLYSPALSSLDEFPKATTPTTKSDGNLSNGAVKFNGSLKDSVSVYVTSNPLCEGVKFIDPSGQIIQLERDDSIYSSGSSICEDERGKKPKVPDGGWGWVVVFASLVISMIADGISFSFGLLYIEFLDHFRESKSKTAWIGSLFMAVPLLSGPIMSALVDRYGCKWMTILGGLVSGAGFIISAFGNSIEWEYVTFGLISGMGLGLCYVTAVVCIAYWFDKKRTLATSLGACGTGIGTFIYAPLTQYFIEEYGWRGTVLLLAGTFLNMCVCGTLMQDPEWLTTEHSKQTSLAGTKSVKNISSCGSISGAGEVESQFPGSEEIRKLLKSGQTPEYILTTLVTSTAGDNPEKEKDKEDESAPTAFRSVVNLPTFVRQSEKVPLEVLEQLSSNKRVFNVVLETYPSLLYCRSNSDNGKLNQLPPDAVIATRIPVTMSMKVKATKKKTSPLASPTELSDTCIVPLLQKEDPAVVVKSCVQNKTPYSPPLAARDIPWLRHQFSFKEPGHHYLKNIRLHRNSVMYRGAMLNIPRYRLRASSCPDIYRNSMTTIAKENQEKWYADALELVKGMFDFSMFLEFHFLLMSVGTILLFIWFIVPYFYLAEHMTRHGYTEVEASRILSLIGITNTIGMVTLGWAGDQPWMHVTKTYAACLVLCGVSTILMPVFTYNYYLLAATCGSFGVFFASNYSFTPTILVELIPLERFTTAYGLTLLCQGIGNLIGPPLAGWMFDMTQSWDISFYTAGVWIIVAGILVAFIPVTKNRRIWGSGMLEMDRVSNT